MAERWGDPIQRDQGHCDDLLDSRRVELPQHLHHLILPSNPGVSRICTVGTTSASCSMVCGRIRSCGPRGSPGQVAGNRRALPRTGLLGRKDHGPATKRRERHLKHTSLMREGRKSTSGSAVHLHVEQKKNEKNCQMPLETDACTCTQTSDQAVRCSRKHKLDVISQKIHMFLCSSGEAATRGDCRT